MTVAEATTMRTNVLAALNGTLAAGLTEYEIDGRKVTRIPPSELMTILSQLDALIDRATNGGFMVMQTRDPD